jgi:hypothetical protein
MGLFSKGPSESEVNKAISLQKDLAKYNKMYYGALKNYLNIIKTHDRSHPEVQKTGKLLDYTGSKVKEVGMAYNNLSQEVKSKADDVTNFSYRKEYLYYRNLCNQLLGR